MSLDLPYEDEPFYPYRHITLRFGVHIMCAAIRVVPRDPGHVAKENRLMVSSYNPHLITWRR